MQVEVPSLPEVHRSVTIPKGVSRLRRFLAFAGPGYLVSVGYMDPGNWATDLAGGSQFGYALLWVILLSNLMAQLLQTLCVRLGIVTGRDLAQACRDYYKKPASIALWLLCEIAIIACDLAEVIGSATAIYLLSGGRIPMVAGVLITGLDVLALLALMRYGFRLLEAIVITLVGTVAGCFALEMFLAKPDWSGVAQGLVTPSPLSGSSLLIATGILGATVMPHNLYLHSAVVQTRAHDRTPSGLRQAIRHCTLDTIVALSAAFFVNAAILVLAAAVFYQKGQVVTELTQAHELLNPLLGGAAATAFAVALLASGQSSTITGTLAGQIVMEGFLRIRIAPWKRRLITRLLAIIPAVILVTITGGHKSIDMLVWSQVVLSMQLSFAIFPLMMFTSDRHKMGEFANPLWLQIIGYAVCLLIAALNVKLVYDTIGREWSLALAAVGLGFSLWVKYGYKTLPSRIAQVPKESAQ
jgi:manganese transport protein